MRKKSRNHRGVEIRKKLALLCAAALLAGSLSACGGNGSGSSQSGSDSGGTEAGGAGATMGADVVTFQVPSNTEYAIPKEKSETVNVTADASGNPEEVSVEVELSGISGSDPILDSSILTEIQNTEGDEAYTAVGKARYAWENKGEDIHYKGISKSDLPVSVKIRYYLDGRELQPEAMAGQSGKVKIRIEYTNNTSETVKLPSGEQRETCVPFLMLTAVLLDGEKFSDIEVDHGKVIDLDDQTVVIGYGLPGLEDSLALTDYEPTEDIELPESVEIRAQVTDFSLDFTATVASTGLFGDIEEEDLDDLDKVSEDMEEFTDASSELVDAAEELSDGGSTFGDYLGQYFGGLSALGQGTSALDEGLQLLAANGAQLSSGAESLQQGLTSLETALAGIDLSALSAGESDGSDGEDSQGKSSASQGTSVSQESAAAALQTLTEDAQILSAQLSGVQQTLVSIDDFMQQAQNYKESVEAAQAAAASVEIPSLEDVETNLAESLSGSLSESATEQARSEVQASVQTAAKKAALAAAEKASKEMEEKTGESLSEEEIQKIAASAADSAVQDAGDDVSVTLHIEEEDLQDLQGIVDQINEAYAPVMEALEAIPELTIPDLGTQEETQGQSAGEILENKQIQEIEATVTSMQNSLQIVGSYAQDLSALTESLTALQGALSQLQAGVTALKEGSEGLAEGTTAFVSGISQVAEGSSQLNAAMEQVVSAGEQLSGAYGQLVSGLEAFADGISEFDEEGIGALADLAGDDYKNVVSGIRALREAELSYDNYSGILDGQEGSVRFLIETDEIEE